ncbi:hypothetical protein D3C76_545250 [compost metagenome]
MNGLRLHFLFHLLEALEGLHMQPFQAAEEFAGAERIERRAGKPLAQRLEQARHHHQQLHARLRLFVRLDAPDQLVHGRQRRTPLFRVDTVLQAIQQQHLAPGFLQQAHHHLRQGAAQHALVQHTLDFLAGQFGAHAAFFGIADALFEQFAAAPLRAGEDDEVFQQLGEDRRVIGEIVEQAHHHLLDLLEQAVALHIVLFAPAERRRSDLVEQAPRRMAAMAEEGLVEHGDLEHGNLHPPDQRLERIRQGAVIEDEFEEHRHQVDDVLVDLADHPRTPAPVADAHQQLIEALPHVQFIEALRRHVRLQVGKQAHQVVAGDRQGIGRHCPPGSAAATYLGQQLLQGIERLLATGIGKLRSRRGDGMFRLPGAASRHAAMLRTRRRGALQLRQHTMRHQHLIGLGVEVPGIAQHVFFEQFEDDQLDLDLDTQPLAGLEERLAQQARPHRVGLVLDLAGDQGIQAGAQVRQRGGIAAHHLGYHGVQRDGLFQFVVLYQGQAVGGNRFEHRALGDVVLVEAGDVIGKFLQETALDSLALQAQVAHRLEESVLFTVAGGAIRHLEQRVVGIVEQRLHGVLQLPGELVAHTDQRHGQTAHGRSLRLPCSGLVQRHYVRVVLHRKSPAAGPGGDPWTAHSTNASSVTTISWRQNRKAAALFRKDPSQPINISHIVDRNHSSRFFRPSHLLNSSKPLLPHTRRRAARIIPPPRIRSPRCRTSTLPTSPGKSRPTSAPPWPRTSAAATSPPS